MATPTNPRALAPLQAKNPIAPVIGRLPAKKFAELYSVQVLRAAAATSVIFHHVPFIRRGGFGVDIFFVISGFIITYISSINSDNFLLKRIFRVLPLYWVGTLGVFLVALLLPKLLNSTTANFEHLLKSLFFIPYIKENGSPEPVLFLGWSLEYEMFFYLLFAAALTISKKASHILVMVPIILAVILGTVTAPASTILYFYSRPIMLEFVFGILAFMFWSKQKQALDKIPLIIAACGALLAYLALYRLDSHATQSFHYLFTGTPGALVRGLLAFLLLLFFLSLEDKIKFPAFLLIIGDASYSLYLLHPYVIQIIFKKFAPAKNFTAIGLAALLAGLGLAFLVAILSFRFFEKPSNEFLRRRFLPQKPVRSRA